MKSYLRTLPRFTGNIGVAFFFSCLFHIFFFSHVPLHNDYVPIQDSYSYPILVPISLVCSVLLALAYVFNKSKYWLFSTQVWFLNFLIFFALMLIGWPIGGGVYQAGILFITLFHALIYIVISKENTFAARKLIKFVPLRIFITYLIFF